MTSPPQRKVCLITTAKFPNATTKKRSDKEHPKKQKDNVKNWSFALLELQVPELLPKGLLLSRSSQTGRPKHRRVVPIERELISESSFC
jgi:hypothetical protein